MQNSQPVIQVEGLTKSFGQQRILHGLDFSVYPGEVFGFLGPNGAGKTTTIRLLLGLSTPSSGRGLLWGRDPIREKDSVLRRVGVVFEHSNIYERLSGYQNLQLFADLYGIPQQRIHELLAQLELETAGRKQVRHYSKGMRQRLLLCRALLHDPELLIMDEPTSGLDPTSQRYIRQVILAMAKAGKTVFLSTHSLEEADEICSRVAVLYAGKTAAVERPSVLKEKYGHPNLIVTLRCQDTVQLRALLEEHQLEAHPEDADRWQILLPLDVSPWHDQLGLLRSCGEIVSLHSQEASLQEVYHLLTQSTQE